MNYDFDVAVIGAGRAGLVASLAADAQGAKVALIEGGKIGGESLWSGSVPSKTLVRSAKVYEIVKRSEEFGIHIEKPRVVWPAVRLRLADVRDEIRRLERDELAKSKVEVINGYARFTDEHTLEIENSGEKRTLTAQKFVLATGATPTIPTISGLEEAGFITPEGLYERPNLPRSLVFIGGGSVACELAQAFVRFGAKVTLIAEEAQLLPREEAEISVHLTKILRAEGIEVHLNAPITGVEVDNGRKIVHFASEGEDKKAEAGEIVVTVGKSPRFEGFGLELAGVEAVASGIKVNEHLQTSVPHIWACGDALGSEFQGRDYYASIAEYEAKVAGTNAASGTGQKVDYRGLARVTFTDPEIAQIGLSLAEAKQNRGEIKTIRSEFKTLDRASIEGETGGFILLHVTEEQRIVGASIIGHNASEIVAGLIPLVRAEASLQELGETIYPYPTMSDILHRAGIQVQRETPESPVLRWGLGVWNRLTQSDETA